MSTVGGRSGLLLSLCLLLLFLLHNNQADDGCPSGRQLWRCGDVCTNVKLGSRKFDCTCGDTTFGPDDGMWCCAKNCSTTDDEDKRFISWSNAVCPDGVALRLDQSCNNTCNQHLSDGDRNLQTSRSYIAACTNSNTCVKEADGSTMGGDYQPTICTGNSSCEGELAWCKSQERKNETCNAWYIRCSTIFEGKHETNNANGMPGQCIEELKVGDENTYHCIDRGDENPYKKAKTQVEAQEIDLEKLKSCTIKRPKDIGLGLQCSFTENDNCQERWCDNTGFAPAECPVLGSGITTRNPKVCQDHTFWRDKPCTEDSKRCLAGNNGECALIEYWGLEGEKDVFGREHSCMDGSDLYRPIDEAGQSSSETRVWKTRPITEGQYNDFLSLPWGKDITMFKYIKDPSTALLIVTEVDPFHVPAITEEDHERGPLVGVMWDKKREWPDFFKEEHYVKDETNGLLLAPITAEACQAKGFFNCKVKGSETCLHKSQVCNLHAQCDPNPAKDADTAEDEFQCDEKYWEKRLISRQASYRCQSPHHNKESKRNKASLGVVWIRAVLNDGNIECWNGEDEEERETDLVTFYLPVLSLAALVIVSITAPLVLRTCFRGGKDFQGRPGQDKTLKTLAEGSPAEVKKLLDEEKISSSLA